MLNSRVIQCNLRLFMLRNLRYGVQLSVRPMMGGQLDPTENIRSEAITVML